MDGPDVGAGGVDLDGSYIVYADTGLVSIHNPLTTGTPGTVGDTDIVRSGGTASVPTAAGSFSRFPALLPAKRMERLASRGRRRYCQTANPIDCSLHNRDGFLANAISSTGVAFEGRSRMSQGRSMLIGGRYYTWAREAK